ncbi:hypothetical protein A9G11_03860 [Gilliamella sp. wkB108]|uniref:DUF4139 domain-containing protein n=1 Tax=Gilliamella sp. wkB108 TaxID=3120256 RepID=UPI00080E635F|nr:DUF4139 domain-containing protein [Gilliamella apicola]OCG24224.1 hypothetical protein A9G11_03860 [Gilliamella apicola]
MKIQKIALLIAVISGSAFADNNITLNKVTLFLKGAELQGQSTVSLTKGESEILLTGIADGVNPNSINVGFNSDTSIKILSTTLKNNDVAKREESSELKSLGDQLQQLETKYVTTEIQLKAVSETVTLLQGNRLDGLVKTAHDELTDMKNVLDFVKTNLATALNEQYTLQTELDKLEQQLSDCKQKIEQARAASHNLNNAIAVKVYSDKKVELPMTLSYVTENAGWKPVYDVRVADINSPLQLTYKADVYQQTGLDWQNIDFSLSTANPSEGITAPELTPWHVDMYSNEKGGGFFFSKSEKDYDQISARVSKSVNPMIDNVLINATGIDTRFDVKLPYTIKTNSQNNILTLQDKQVEAKYRYISIPKLDSNAYLQAQIADWDKLNLLPGKSTVFFNGNYIGESFITTADVKDTLNLSLGRDKNILITRNRNLDETSKPSFFKDEVSQKYAYIITVKNTKPLPIDIAIYDQLPLIHHKTIELDDAKYGDATYDKDTGLLAWEFTLKPSEAKNLNLSFKLTYPNDKANTIIGL